MVAVITAAAAVLVVVVLVLVVVVVVAMAVVPNTLFPCVQQSLCEIPTQQSVCSIFRNGTLSRMTKWHQPTQETGRVRAGIAGYHFVF